jgi:hypothetical protein
MAETDKLDCNYCKYREKYKDFLKERISQREKIILVSKFFRLKRNDEGVLEKTIETPKYCFIGSEKKLPEIQFQIAIDNYTLNIPYGTIKEIWEDVSGTINLELRFQVVFDENATRDDKKMRLEPMQ